ncbi:hypothetical protein [Lysobacter sp. CFH 32150]|uniref:hypothetical protein n=1 Tax=Lysobacter sp. CFH 32150 TaxID=2927128 RepID=UPI001FA6E95E|nr:hypothetical protein [Lysobacter sp. CFH 32150]MCI4566650.1 hypothetical protein [Lysobacter sp. CFH 32150]
MAARHPAPPQAFIDKLRLVCLDLPEVCEESAWTGTRWSISKKNFAHVVMIDAGWPPAYARVAKSTGPLCVLTFRSPRPAGDTPRFARPPYFLPGWWPNIVGMVLNADTDWDEVEKLIVASYCVLAPKKLGDWVIATRG